ncbi:MAG: DoxX family protein [Myxococcota bacterium]
MNDVALSPSAAPSGALHIVLWVVQVLLAAAFLMAGAMKLTTPSADLVAQGMTWVESFPAFLPTFAGVVEVLGALGLVLPSATRVQPKLTVYAAAGLVLVMVVAAGIHISIGEASMIAPNIVLGGLAAFVAWGRSSKAVIPPR